MTVLHRQNKHGNADGLSRIPDETDFCNCYQAGVDLADLPCKSCKFCNKASQQWPRFESDEDNVVLLAVRTVSVQPEGQELQ